MSASSSRLAHIGTVESEPNVPWVLLLGGCTRPGNRRARRTVGKAIELGLQVIWIDGFEEEVEGQSVPVEGIATDAGLIIVGVREAEVAATHQTTRAKVARLLPNGSSNAGVQRISRFLRRSLQIGRSRRFHRLQQAVINQITTSTPPAAVVYCDDTAITTAWHLSRRWPQVVVDSELKIREPAGSSSD